MADDSSVDATAAIGRPPAKEELIQLLRARDRAVRRIRFDYVWHDSGGAEEVGPRWSQHGWVSLDRGRIASGRWTFGLGQAPQWEWTIWDGSRCSTASGSGVLETDGALPARHVSLRAESLDAQSFLAVTQSNLSGALAASVAGAATGLLYRWESWSQRFAMTEDMQVLGFQEIDGERVLAVLFDASNAPDGRSNGTYEQPHCVWFDWGTLLAVRVQAYVEVDKMRTAQFDLQPPSDVSMPAPLDERWAPLRFVALREHRVLDGGLHIGTRAEFGVASQGSPFYETEVRILEPSRPGDETLAADFALPVKFPLTVADSVRGRQFVLGNMGGPPCSTFDLAFWSMLVQHRASLDGAVRAELEPLFDVAPSSAVAVLTFLDRALGALTPVADLLEGLPPGAEQDDSSLDLGHLEAGAQRLGMRTLRKRGDLEELGRIQGAFVVCRPIQKRSRVTSAFAIVVAIRAGFAEVMVPGVGFEVVSLEQFEREWDLEALVIRRSQEALANAVRRATTR